MAIINQFSRIQHHTLTTPGATFSIPTQEDFTDPLYPWTSTDLCLSEIGVNEDDKRVYIRTGDEILELIDSLHLGAGLSFSGGILTSGGTAAGYQTLAQTLALGNVSGPYDISMDNGQKIIASSVSNNWAQFDFLGTDIYLNRSYNSSLLLQLDATLKSTNNSVILDSKTGIYAIGGNFDMDVKTFSFQGDCPTYGTSKWVFKSNEVQTVGLTTSEIAHIDVGSAYVTTVRAMVQAIDIPNSLAYGIELFATFKNYLGTITQVGTCSVSTPMTEFGANVVATINVPLLLNKPAILVTGDTGKTINWVCRYEYMTSQ